MTDQQFFHIAGYLANPIRETVIEIEIPAKDQTRFENDYAARTQNYSLPQNTNVAPYYIWGAGANKWGIEARVYFVSNENLPQPLYDILEPRKVQNRPGYENWERRFSIKEIVYQLFECGFVLGSPQDENRIRGFIPPQFINDFNNGFNL